MAHKRYVIRIVTHSVTSEEKALESTALLECLDRAGVVQRHESDHDGVVFDILPPASISAEGSQTWARMNADRMQTFGLNAVCAPEWPKG